MNMPEIPISPLDSDPKTAVLDKQVPYTPLKNVNSKPERNNKFREVLLITHNFESPTVLNTSYICIKCKIYITELCVY